MTSPITLPYVPPKGPIRAAIECIIHGVFLSCTREDWPSIKRALIEQIDEWKYLDTKTSNWLARLAYSEINRVDSYFSDLSVLEIVEQGVIIPLAPEV